MKLAEILAAIAHLDESDKLIIYKTLELELKQSDVFMPARSEHTGFFDLAQAQAKLSEVQELATENPQKARSAAYSLLGMYCWYCGIQEAPSWMIVEHQTPRSRGGSADGNNLVMACRSCNSQKSDRTVEEFRAVIAARAGSEPGEVVFVGEEHSYREWENGLRQLLAVLR